MTIKRKISIPNTRNVKTKLPGYCRRTAMVMDKLDDNLLCDILTRLPAKTVGQLKIINKRWYALISDPFFVNKHTRLQTNRDAHSFFTNFSTKKDLEQVSFDPSSPRSLLSHTNFSIGLPEKFKGSFVSTVQSCHGLLLLVLNSRAYTLCVFNPLTKRKHLVSFAKKIPVRCNRKFGLVFAQKSSSPYYYNVVCLVAAKTAFQFKIFSPEVGRWRDSAKTSMISYRNGLNKDSIRIRCTPVSFRGIIHFLTIKGDIIAFNAGKEETRIIEIPTSIYEIKTILNVPWWDRIWVGVVEDEVTLVVVTPKHEMIIWVLHDYENKRWRIKRKIVIRTQRNRTILPIFFDGERFVFYIEIGPSDFYWQEYNINSGVLGPLCPKWGCYCYPNMSTLTEVLGSKEAS